MLTRLKFKSVSTTAICSWIKTPYHPYQLIHCYYYIYLEGWSEPQGSVQQADWDFEAGSTCGPVPSYAATLWAKDIHKTYACVHMCVYITFPPLLLHWSLPDTCQVKFVTKFFFQSVQLFQPRQTGTVLPLSLQHIVFQPWANKEMATVRQLYRNSPLYFIQIHNIYINY